MIHKTAIVHPKAKLAPSVEVGPYAIIGEDVVIGEGTKVLAHSVLEGPYLVIGENNEIGPHAYLKSHTTVGNHNRFFPFSAIGAEPQDLKFHNEDSKVVIGDHNTFRESVTVNRGTEHGGGLTKVGSHGLFMAYVHIAHDCIVGDYVVIANNVNLAGHVTIHDHVVIGGMVGITQFCQIGKFAYLGGMITVPRDVPPFLIVAGSLRDVNIRGINIVGLKRNGFSNDVIRRLKETYTILFDHELTLQEGLEKLKTDSLFKTPEIQYLVEFIENSKQGILGRKHESEIRKAEHSRDRGGLPRELSH